MPEESDLAPNQHVETIDGVEFVFTGITAQTRDISEQERIETPPQSE